MGERALRGPLPRKCALPGPSRTREPTRARAIHVGRQERTPCAFEEPQAYLAKETGCLGALGPVWHARDGPDPGNRPTRAQAKCPGPPFRPAHDFALVKDLTARAKA
eukprot:4644291-Prymnesium_polylepis.1